MAQACIDLKTEHQPVIERYYDETVPEQVMRIFRCELCAHLMDKDVIYKWNDDDFEHEGYTTKPDGFVEDTD